MLSKILTVVLLVSAYGCTKEFKKSDNDGVGTATELNDGHHESIIGKLGSKADLTPRERYYLGSAYSQKAGVDVYSLYSVLEIQLFHKKALDWSKLSTDKNPYLKFMKTQDGIDYEKRQKLRVARWDDFLPDLKRKHRINDIQTFEEITTDPDCDCKNLTREEYDSANEEFKTIANNVREKKPNLKNYLDHWYKHPSQVYSTGKYENYNFYYKLRNQHMGEIQIETMKDEYLDPQDPKTAFGGMTWELIMNILWNTYEAIPIMKKLPNLTPVQQADLTSALDVYFPLLENKEFKDVSLKNFLILGTVSLMSVYSSSFELDAVDSMQDLLCSFNPQVLIDNYGLIRKRLVLLQKASMLMNIEDKRFKEYKEKIDSMEESSQEELSDEKKVNFIQDVRTFKLDQCFPS